ncbi:MAG: hypothetical protein HOM55_10785 [Proteobacteria bacterium]|nr:hypothetical protein [Pseudomonadota bacterium]
MQRISNNPLQTITAVIVFGLFILACGGDTSGGGGGGGGSACNDSRFPRACHFDGANFLDRAVHCCPNASPYYCPSAGANPCMTLFQQGFGGLCPGQAGLCRP